VSRIARARTYVTSLSSSSECYGSPNRQATAVVSVRMRFPSIVFKTAGGSEGWVTVKRNVEDGATVAALLADLVATYPGFRESVYNPESGVVNEQIGVVLNGKLLTFSDISETRLSNNDEVLVQPIYSGG
jgi:molybdopterin converting factor small subunit